MSGRRRRMYRSRAGALSSCVFVSMYRSVAKTPVNSPVAASKPLWRITPTSGRRPTPLIRRPRNLSPWRI